MTCICTSTHMQPPTYTIHRERETEREGEREWEREGEREREERERERCQAMAHVFNPSTWEAEAGRFLSSRPARSTE